MMCSVIIINHVDRTNSVSVIYAGLSIDALKLCSPACKPSESNIFSHIECVM